jgi:uncharacterized membrane protein
MDKTRMEAFTDGVIAIIITIMVLDMKIPTGSDLGALRSVLPLFLAYALSFANVAIFWNNHHHMLQATEKINGNVLWANTALLFWISLSPFALRWMDDTHFASTPTAVYGVVLVMMATTYIFLARTIIACTGPRHRLRQHNQNLPHGLPRRGSTRFRQPLDLYRPLRLHRHDLVHPRPPHRILPKRSTDL